MSDETLIHSDPRPTRSDATRNRELLIASARRLFSEYGADAVSMAAVAQDAGVGKGTLYRNFASKLDLYQALLDADQRDLQDRTLARLRAGGDARIDLEWFLTEVIAFVARSGDLLGAVDDPAPTLDHPSHHWWWLTLRGLLRRLTVAIDVEYAADTLYLLIDPRAIAFQRRTRALSPEVITEQVIALLGRLLA